MAPLRYWLWLSKCAGAGNRSAIRLLNHFGTPEKAYFAETGQIDRIEGLAQKDARAFSDKSMDEVNGIMERCERLGIRIITIQDAEYPDRLKNIYDPPCVLYVKGRVLDFDEEVAIAVVGSRRATRYGIAAAERISKRLSECGAVIISGMASGIDSSAHTGALMAKAPTVAVLGCGVDVIYPPSNKTLYQKIAENGTIISEYPPGTRPYGSNFPVRNRIISGLSLGVVVVEAPEKSGALITAGLALEQGRDVFAVPGNIDAFESAGSNRLIRDGAILVGDAWDILREYVSQYPDKIVERLAPAQRPAAGMPSAKGKETGTDKDEDENIGLAEAIKGLDGGERSIIASLGSAPLHVDEITEATGLPVSKVLSLLTMLELKGLVKQQSGKTFRLNTEANIFGPEGEYAKNKN